MRDLARLKVRAAAAGPSGAQIIQPAAAGPSGAQIIQPIIWNPGLRRPRTWEDTARLIVRTLQGS